MGKFWLILLLLVPLSAAADYVFSGANSKSFLDAGDVGSRDEDWDDGTIITVGDGGAPNNSPSFVPNDFESLKTETATHLIYATTSGVRRTVAEMSLADIVANEGGTLTVYFDTVPKAIEIEIYAYAGDGVIEASDADVSGDTLVGSYTPTVNIYDYDHSLSIATFDISTISSLLDTQIAADGYIGIVVMIKDDLTTNDSILSMWTGEQVHKRTNRPGPFFTINCVPNCAEPVEDYIPNLPTLGSYASAPAGICTELPHEVGVAEVTLASGETLNNAFDRLKVIDQGDGTYDGGVINVPYETDTVQCDTFYANVGALAPDDGTYKLSIKGTPDPLTGRLPRFYCRDIGRDGTISSAENAGTFYTPGAPNTRQLLVENIEIDGYKKHFAVGNGGRLVLRNMYMHHAFGDGVAFSNAYIGDSDFSVEVCGGEHAFSGRDNVQHQFYIHRGVASGQSGTREVRAHFYDNKIHSCGYSSCIKSIANENYVKGNWIKMSANPDGAETDSTFTRQYSQIAVDWAVCSTTEIIDNTIIGYKPSASATGDFLIAGRNRAKIVNGCDTPSYYTYTTDVTSDGPYDTDAPNPDFFDDAFWTGLGGAKTKITKVEDNTFIIGEGPADSFYYALDITGTFPLWEARLGIAYWLQAPTLWYERSQTQLSGNTYIGFASNHLYRERIPNDCTNTSIGCPAETYTAGMVFPDGEDTTAPWFPQSEYCSVEDSSNTSGICTLTESPPLFYTITGTETVQ